jgi:Nif-specific regulatory protein
LPEGSEPAPYSLEVVKFWDIEHGEKADTIEMSETILTRIQRDRKAVLVNDLADREDFGHSVIDLKIRSFICAPLTYAERCLGLVYIDTRGGREQFDKNELQFVSAVGRIAGLCLQNIRIQTNLSLENIRLRSLVSNSGKLVGSSAAMENVFRLIQKVAPRDTSVLITGENGTGKELIARQVHEQSEQKDKPFVAVNCGAIPANLVESELFGYEKGAFTGAESTTPGKFELANEGTLFLDEIGEMPLDMQVKILRALQERKFFRVGGKAEIEVQIRVLSATNRDLKDAIETGEFREDLYFRLAVVTIDAPPLRDRDDDIIEIAEHFLQEEGEGIELTEPARECLQQYRWPGNIRELKNALEQAAILGDGKQITPSDLPSEIGKVGRGRMKFLLKTLGEVEKQYILRVLEETGGNKARASKILGISRETLYQKLKTFEEK